MSSLLPSTFPSLLHSTTLPPSYRKPVILAATAAALSTPLLAYARRCYAEWLALGRGGVPYNFLGWLVQAALHAVARSDVRDPVPRAYTSVEDVAALYGEAGARSYYGVNSNSDTEGGDENGKRGDESKEEIPPRNGARPTVPTFVAPQRQTSDFGPARTVETLNNLLAGLAAANPGMFELRTSRLEGPPHQAVWLLPPPPSTETETAEEQQNEDKQDESEKEKEKEKEKENEATMQTRLGRGAAGEFAHVHGEGSAHMVLSPPDAAAAIARGWAERHALSGVGGRFAMAPWGYVMVYAPRDADELRVWRQLLLASARYVAVGRGRVEVPA